MICLSRRVARGLGGGDPAFSCSESEGESVGVDEGGVAGRTNKGGT